MPWVRLDDHFDENPKIAQIGPFGIALWVTALAYCNRNLTDGFIPWSVARKLVAWEWLEPDDRPELLTADELAEPKRLLTAAFNCGMHGEDVESPYVIKLLVCAGLWDEVDGGYQIHDYADFQPTKAQVESERAAKVAAGQAGGIAAAQAKRQRALQQNPSRHPSKTLAESKPVPDPVPDPVPNSSSLSAGARNARDWFEALNHRAPPNAILRETLANIDTAHPPDCIRAIFEASADKDDPWRYAKAVFDTCLIEGHEPRVKEKGHGPRASIGAGQGGRSVRQGDGRHIPASQRVPGAGVDYDAAEREHERIIAGAIGRVAGLPAEEMGQDV